MREILFASCAPGRELSGVALCVLGGGMAGPFPERGQEEGDVAKANGAGRCVVVVVREAWGPCPSIIGS